MVPLSKSLMCRKSLRPVLAETSQVTSQLLGLCMPIEHASMGMKYRHQFPRQMSFLRKNLRLPARKACQFFIYLFIFSHGSIIERDDEGENIRLFCMSTDAKVVSSSRSHQKSTEFLHGMQSGFPERRLKGLPILLIQRTMQNAGRAPFRFTFFALLPVFRRRAPFCSDRPLPSPPSGGSPLLCFIFVSEQQERASDTVVSLHRTHPSVRLTIHPHRTTVRRSVP